MKISLEGYGENTATLAAAEGLLPGRPTAITGNGEAGPCPEGAPFCGVALSVRKGFAAVQLAGYARLAYTGAAPALGYTALCGDGAGGVQAGGDRKLLVIDVNETDKSCGVIL